MVEERAAVFTALMLAIALIAVRAAPPRSSTAGAPLIIGHRGASGHRPEHTLASYRLAAIMGADFIEPDLVSTQDGVLIARHENEIGDTTDVATKFPDRRRTKRIDEVDVTGWFTEDFTLAEIKTLRAKERLPFRSHNFDGLFEVPTFDEVVELAQRMSAEMGRPIGVYPETKHPAYFRSIGLPLEERLLDSLARQGWNRRDSPVFIESFEDNLRRMRTQTGVRMIRLLEGDVPSDAELREIATYADGIGPDARMVLPVDGHRRLQPPTDLVKRAHAAGLLVHIWTLRGEPEFLSPSYHGDFDAEFRQFRDLGVDGIFTDFPDAAYRALH
jgi:glycerophosphoryl diester phosphodiesterase